MLKGCPPPAPCSRGPESPRLSPGNLHRSFDVTSIAPVSLLPLRSSIPLVPSAPPPNAQEVLGGAVRHDTAMTSGDR